MKNTYKSMITNILIIEKDRIPKDSAMYRLMANLDIFIIVEDDIFYYKKCRYADTCNKKYSKEITFDMHMKIWNNFNGKSTNLCNIVEVIEKTHIKGDFLGIYDKNGRPVMDGDTLNFIKPSELYNGIEETFNLKNMIGRWPYVGTRDDVPLWREITNR